MKLPHAFRPLSFLIRLLEKKIAERVDRSSAGRGGFPATYRPLLDSLLEEPPEGEQAIRTCFFNLQRLRMGNAKCTKKIKIVFLKFLLTSTELFHSPWNMWPQMHNVGLHVFTLCMLRLSYSVRHLKKMCHCDVFCAFTLCVHISCMASTVT